MDLFDRDALETLAHLQDTPCVSLFMPTVRFEADLAQNPIRFKNLMKEAYRQLEATGHRESEAQKILQPAHELLDRSDYWFTMSEGLAGFFAPGFSALYRLPLEFDELVVAGPRFHLKPLFPIIASNNRFYLLALSQNKVRLFQGTHFSISEVEARDIPKDIYEAVLKYEVHEQSLQFHTGAKVSAAGGRHDQIAHGQGRQSDDLASRPQDLVRRYFQSVDEGVMQVLRDETAPLVLACVDHYLPIYRQANSFPHLVEDEVVTGNPDHLSGKELHQKAWRVVEPIFKAAQDESVAQFHQRVNREGGLASADLKEIIPASLYSRVDTLFVPIGEHRWGHYHRDGNTVELHEQRQAGDEDLLNFAAVHAYLNGGVVHALKPANMPVPEGPAATFRFPADVAASERQEG